MPSHSTSHLNYITLCALRAHHRLRSRRLRGCRMIIITSNLFSSQNSNSIRRRRTRCLSHAQKWIWKSIEGTTVGGGSWSHIVERKGAKNRNQGANSLSLNQLFGSGRQENKISSFSTITNDLSSQKPTPFHEIPLLLKNVTLCRN